MKTAQLIQNGARASARFSVRSGTAQEMFSPLLPSMLKRRERRASIFSPSTIN
jgi:hypothetical protein